MTLVMPATFITSATIVFSTGTAISLPGVAGTPVIKSDVMKVRITIVLRKYTTRRDILPHFGGFRRRY